MSNDLRSWMTNLDDYLVSEYGYWNIVYHHLVTLWFKEQFGDDCIDFQLVTQQINYNINPELSIGEQCLVLIVKAVFLNYMSNEEGLRAVKTVYTYYEGDVPVKVYGY